MLGKLYELKNIHFMPESSIKYVIISTQNVIKICPKIRPLIRIRETYIECSYSYIGIRKHEIHEIGSGTKLYYILVKGY